MKILFVIGATKSGGAEKRAILISQLLKEKMDTKVFAFYGPNNEGVDFVYKKDYLDYKNQSISNRIKALRMFIDGYKPDIIMSFVPHINYFATRALKQNRFKSIKHVVAMVFHNFSFISTVLLKHSLRRADAVYFQNEEQKQLFNCKCKSFVLPNPITVGKIVQEKPKYKFMSVGRLESQKDFNLLINSFYYIKIAIPSATLDIYGSGSKQNELQTLIDSLKLKDFVNISNYVDDINRVYDDHDAFLFTTKEEGFPNALAEAMGHGLICFTTFFKTGCNELIIDGKTGYISNNRDPREYADLVINKISNYSNASIVGVTGYEFIKQKCNTKVFVDKLEKELYELKK